MDYGNWDRKHHFNEKGIQLSELNEINKFFKNPKKIPMPKLLLYFTINQREHIISGKLETMIESSSDLRRDFFPEIKEKIPEFFKEQEKFAKGVIENIAIPLVCKTITDQISEYYIYHPESGKFIGEYKVELPF
jgi:hypothetical protein